MTTIDRRNRKQEWIEYWIPAGSAAKDVTKILMEARHVWFSVHKTAYLADDWPEYDDWYTIHPHDEHVIIRIKCPDETS